MLYYIPKVVEGIHGENLKMENSVLGPLPTTLGYQPLKRNGLFSISRTDTETLFALSSKRLQQDDRHFRVTLCISFRGRL